MRYIGRSPMFGKTEGSHSHSESEKSKGLGMLGTGSSQALETSRVKPICSVSHKNIFRIMLQPSISMIGKTIIPLYRLSGTSGTSKHGVENPRDGTHHHGCSKFLLILETEDGNTPYFFPAMRRLSFLPRTQCISMPLTNSV
jgi:hypothetical protein